MARDKCLAVSAYPIPLSIYEFADSDAVDEVFKRINSGGRQLSRQELRAAGAINAFADVVRVISSRVRGDTTNSNIVVLRAMNEISITNKELDYGINADDVFWVKNGILTKDHLRQSRDEELVADLVAYMVSESPVASRTELFDDYFGNTFPLSGTSLERFNAMDQAIRKRNPDLVDFDYQRTHDAVVLILDQAKATFASLLFPDGNAGNPVPRYFQVVFLALHDLIVRKGMIIADRAGVVAALSDKGKHITIQEGGRWGADNRAAAVNSVVGMIQGSFEPDKNPDPARVHWVTKLQNLLTNSKTEQAAYDFKQGFLELSQSPSFDEGSFSKILETCSAIANISPGHKGYVIVGVAEKLATANRVEEIFKVPSLPFSGFYITGVEHESDHLGKNLDQLFQLISDRIRASSLSEPLRAFLSSHLKFVRYYDKTVVVFEIEGQSQPSLFDGKYFARHGTQVIEVPAAEFPNLFARFK